MSISVEEWIQPQHLTDAAIQEYRDEFAGHPARLLVIADFLQPDKAERLARYLAQDAEYVAEFGLRSAAKHAVPEADWLAAPDDDRFFRYSKLSRVRPGGELSPNTLAYMQFRSAF